MISLIGEHDCKVDDKGRLMFPAAFKKQLAAYIDQGFVIKRNPFKPCLDLLPLSIYQKEANLVNKLSRFRRENEEFRTKFQRGATPVELDPAGRILVPKNQMQFFKIGKEVVLASSIDRIEIWDKEEYYRFIDEGADSFADLAERVMGQIDTATPSDDVP